jgi:serine phosphatase RsbU (regulator of sigma subunit)
MMRLMLENAGAQHGALLLADDQKLSLQAESINASDIRIGNNLALEEAKHIAISVVQYVQKTKQHVVLVNAEREGIFAQDAYIQKNQIRSVMCSPVMHQGKLKAIIYLENNLTTGAFTEERLKVVNLLSSQLAVSLENALLYEDQKRLNEELKNEIAERKRSEEERIKAITESLRKTEELENARKFQLSLLPKAPPKLPNYEIAAFLKTATEVGGDYYDFFVTNPNEFTSIIGDATGHGLSAGMMVGMTKSALNSLQIEQLSPAEMLMRLNTAIKKANPGRLKMALNIARFSGNKVVFSSAAMPPVYHFVAQDHQVKELIVPGLPLGSPMLNSFDNIEFCMLPGDLLIGVSDGLPERKNYEGEELGYPAILEHIAAHKDLSVHEIMNSLNDLGNNWSQGLANDDDITIMVIKRTA